MYNSYITKLLVLSLGLPAAWVAREYKNGHIKISAVGNDILIVYSNGKNHFEIPLTLSAIKSKAKELLGELIKPD